MDLQEWLERLDARLDRVESNLGEHMRRSAAAEEANRMTREELSLIRAEVRPLTLHVAAWAGVAKALAIVGGLVGLAAGALQLLR